MHMLNTTRDPLVSYSDRISVTNESASVVGVESEPVKIHNNSPHMGKMIANFP